MDPTPLDSTGTSPPSEPPAEDLASLATALRQRDAALRRVNRALRIISTFNQLLVHAESEAELVQQACCAVVADCGYRTAWVGFATLNDSKLVTPVATAGFDQGDTENLAVCWSDESHGQGPPGQAIREGRAVVCRDIIQDPKFAPWREAAHLNGFGSSIALPLQTKDAKPGAFSIYASSPDAFDADEISLLQELADDLSYGIVALRTRDEHRRVTDALRQNETRFRLIFEASPNGLCVANAQGRIALVNSRMEELFGYTAAELIGQSVDLLLPERSRAAHLKWRIAFSSTPNIRRMGDRPSYPAKRKDGSEFPADISLHPIEMPEGPMVLATIADISVQVRAEDERRQKEALFNSLVGTIPDKLYVKDRQSRFVQINEGMARHCGLRQASEAVGKTDFDFFSGPHAQQAFDDEQRVMSTGCSLIGVEEKETWPDGRVTWASTTKVPLHDANGRITGLVGISRDITERKNLAAQYLQSQKMEAFGQLAGGVAHDFNNILAAIFLELDLARHDTILPATAIAKLNAIQNLAGRAASLTRQLLLFSRRQDVETQALDLNVVLDGICNLLRRLIGEHILFSVKVAPTPQWIQADAGMVEQVVMNLCINARDAMPQGGRLSLETQVVEFAATTPHPGRHFCLTVTDTGCGMDAATQARIFEPFFTTKPIGKGSGLGLATAYGIVQQHRGWIEVQSESGQGSSFRVYFPAIDPIPAARGTPAAPEIRDGAESILLAEDDAVVRTATAAGLRRVGYRVVEAIDGPDAIRRWHEPGQTIDLLMTDFLMPGGLTGIQLAEHLRELRRSLPVLVVSGYAASPDSEATAWPANIARLEKPFQMHALRAKIRECLDAPQR